ncbi:MAG: hypothetical protein NTV79_08035 [Candidatus Aureabacteria bacterium]|nr:hypothetical protein [Candidatus Auribacterota bacterium]
MKGKNLVPRAWLVIALFIPVALVPGRGRGAPLSSEPSSASAALGAPWDNQAPLSPGAVRAGPLDRLPLLIGGEQRSSPLQTNEVAAIVLTLIILGLMVGFVEQSR